MRICCTICGDLFNSCSTILSTVCGHVFHDICLLQWLENSKSCPQCRHKATEKNIHRLFVDVSPADESQVDPETLQYTIDSLKFKVVEKDQLLSRLKEENDDFKGKTKKLAEEVTKLEKKVKDKDTTLSAYVEQSKHLKELLIKVSKAEVEANKARSQLKQYQHIDEFINGNAEDIDDITANYNISNAQESIKSLATLNSFLKNNVTKLMEEKRRHSEEILAYRNTMKELKKSIVSHESKIKGLEADKSALTEDNKSLEKENASLSKKISALQESIISPSADVKNSVIQRFLAESPAPSVLKKNGSQNMEFDLTPEIIRTVSKNPKSFNSLKLLKEKNSPYLQVKESSINPANYIRPAVQNPNLISNKGDIFKSGRNPMCLKPGPSKVPQECFFPGDDVGYDGLGGHHKVDYFPRPASTKVFPMKKKLKQVHVVTNKGSKNISANPVIKDYFKNTFS